MAAIDFDTVTLDLCGEEYVLTPTLKAAKAINTTFGSIVAAQERCLSLNLDAYVTIIAAGAGVDGREHRNKVERLVYRKGISNLLKDVLEFTSIVANGGTRPPVNGEDADADDARSVAEGNGLH